MTTAMLDLEVHQDIDQDIDAVEEMRLRTWARQNYVPVTERDEDLHPIVLDEMVRKDHDFR
ncbi:MAG: hypothetical protein ACE5KM_07785 [Planctomycetaceae bacterium]